MTLTLLNLLACSTSTTLAPEATPPAASIAMEPVFTAQGFRLESRDRVDDWSVDLTLRSFGRGDEPVQQTVPVEEGARTVYDRGEVLEWYEVRSNGVKQGFDVPSRPGGTGMLKIRLQVQSELFPLFEEDALRLLDDSAQVRVTYEGLVTYDANGDEVPSWMDWSCVDQACTLDLVIEDDEAVYPITVDPLAFTNETVLTAGSTGDHFGRAVDIDGNTAVVGAARANGTGNKSGIAYVWTYDAAGGSWGNPQLLIASSNANDRCGSSVAVRGDVIAVGCPLDDYNGANNAGSVNIYRRPSATASFAHEAKLLITSPVAQERAGVAVDLDAGAGAVIIGATGRNSNNPTRQLAGAAYIFEFDGTNWNQAVRLTAPTSPIDPAFDLRNLFGFSVGIDGDRAIVGAPRYDHSAFTIDAGAVFVFEKSGTWPGAPTTTFDASVLAGLQADDRLGHGVALEGDVAAAGIPYLGPSGNVLVLRRPASTWQVDQFLEASDGQSGDRLGYDVDLKGGRLIAGATRDDASGVNNAGAAVVFQDNGSSFSEEVEVYAGEVGLPDVNATDQDGWTVGISGDWVVTGSRPSNGNPENVHIYQLTTCRGLPSDTGCDVQLAITEIHPNPQNANGARGQFFELYNAGLSAVQLSGAEIATNASAFVLPSSAVIQGQSHKVVVRDRTPGQNGDISGLPGMIEAPIDLDPSNDTLILTAADGITVLANASYAGFNATGTSLQLAYDGSTYADPTVGYDATLPVPTGGNWCHTLDPYLPAQPVDFMSPGRFNHDCGLTFTMDFDYTGAVTVSSSTTYTLGGARFTTGNLGEGNVVVTGDSTGQTLAFTYDSTGVTYNFDVKPYGESCVAGISGGTMSNLPAGVNGTFTVTGCP